MTAAARLTPGSAAKRPSTIGLVLDQVVYATRDLWRTRIVLVFTFVLPLAWLLIIGMLAGNEAVDEATGVRLMQFVTPTAAAMGVLFAALPTVANSLALAREQKIAKRLAGTPLPTWVYLLGRVGGAVIFATAAIVVMLAIGVIAYDVQIQSRTMLATAVTLVMGIACLAALGLAIGALARSANTAQSVALGGAVLLAFISGMMVPSGSLSSWMATVSGFFPVRRLLTSIQEQFNPFKTGGGWQPLDLAVLAVWAIGGLIVAAWALRREPTTSVGPVEAHATRAAGGGLRSSAPGRPAAAALVVDQTWAANTIAWRDLGFVFFGVAMPVGLYALMASQYSDSGYRPHDMPFAFFFMASMAAYGAAVTAFVSVAEVVAMARDRRVLKRLRGTPLAPWQYLAGQTTWSLGIAFVVAALTLGVGTLLFKAHISPEGLPLAVGVMVLGTLTLAACGFALVAIVPSGRSLAAVGLAILLPLSFFSDVFAVGQAPDWMAAVGSIFPLRHFVLALASSLDPAGISIPWTNLAVMTTWLVGASLVAIRFFRWEPKV